MLFRSYDVSFDFDIKFIGAVVLNRPLVGDIPTGLRIGIIMDKQSLGGCCMILERPDHDEVGVKIDTRANVDRAGQGEVLRIDLHMGREVSASHIEGEIVSINVHISQVLSGQTYFPVVGHIESAKIEIDYDVTERQIRIRNDFPTRFVDREIGNGKCISRYMLIRSAVQRKSVIGPRSPVVCDVPFDLDIKIIGGIVLNRPLVGDIALYDQGTIPGGDVL